MSRAVAAECASSRPNRLRALRQRKKGIADAALRDAIRRAESGLIDADLGGGALKQRLARQGQGKSGGYRSIVLFQRGARAFFAYGFAKNERGNIDRRELRVFRLLAAKMLALDDKALEMAMKNGTITEIGEHD